MLELLDREHAIWLVTGAAGFIGSNIVEVLLRSGQKVVGLDNFATGHRRNLDELQRLLPEPYSTHFRMIEGDIRDRATCDEAVQGVDYVLHQAALGSVPRSIDDPLTSHDANVTGFLNMLDASRKAGTRRFVYAASSSTYGDSPELPKREERIGQPLSPYAVTKLVNEVYAAVYARAYGFKAIGLRYFNVFGPRQNPSSQYSGVISRFIDAFMKGGRPVIYGDGEQSRDFTFIANVVDANIKAMEATGGSGEVMNVANGERISLLELVDVMKTVTGREDVQVDFQPERKGDVKHSQADNSRAVEWLGYKKIVGLEDGIRQTIDWWKNSRFAE